MKATLIVIGVLFTGYISFISCKKNSSTSNWGNMQGIVIDYPSKQPVAGTKVYLVKRPVSVIIEDTSNYWSITYLDTFKLSPDIPIDSVISDGNGRFFINAPPNICSSNTCTYYYLPVIIDPNLVTVYPKDDFLHYPDYNLGDTIFIDQPSYFKLQMHKITAASLTDTVFERRYYLNDLNAHFGLTSFYRRVQVGQTDATFIDTISYKAYSRVVVEWRHYNGGLIQSGKDTINLTPYSITQHNVNY